MTSTNSGVSVALRVRPFVDFEAARGDRNIVLYTPGDNRIALSPNDYRIFDYVFGCESTQEEVYESSVTNLVDGIFDGYNATILAYGQTGSGKTYTMGSAFDLKNKVSKNKLGIIPRAVLKIFQRIEADRGRAVEKGTYMPECEVQVQFVEVYMDDIKDLLVQGKQQRNILVVEQDNNIVMKGATTRNVTTAEQLMEALNEGSMKRTTASTKMNDESSRSHAIFSVHMKLQRAKEPEASEKEPQEGNEENELIDIENVRTKFHFVDLAGSECMSQTGAEGHVAKEGIDINMGLFHLGQVINALTSKRTHIPYRSCKLTRLLQDSLGGNSRTLMIACISPSSANERHSLSTLNYASNAKRIQNQVSKNISSAAGQEAALRKKINMLEAELLLYKSGRCVADQGGQGGYSDLYKENLELTKERDKLRLKVESLNAAVDDYQVRMVAYSHREIDAAVAQRRNRTDDDENDENEDPVADLAKKFIEDNHKLNDQLTESRKESEVLQRQVDHLRSCLANNYDVLQDNEGGNQASDVQELIAETVRRVNMLRKVTANEENVVRQETIDEEDEDVDEEHASDEEEDNELDYTMEDQENDEVAIEAEKENERDIRKLVDVNADISSYQKIIDDLVESLKRQAAMQAQYDVKCRALSEQIVNAEKERDKAIESMGAGKTRNNSKEVDRRSKEISAEYERKIKDLKKEHARIKSLEKSLQEAMRKQQKTESDLKKYRDMVTSLQRMKVDLKSKMDTDNKRAQENANKASKRIRDLEKEAVRRDVELRKNKSKDQRTIDQLHKKVEQLEQRVVRQDKPSSQNKTPRSQAVGRRVSLNTSRVELSFRNVTSAVMRNASMIVLNNRRNRDVDALVKERTELESKRRALKMKRRDTRDLAQVEELQMQIDSLANDLEHLEKQIKDHLAQMEDIKDNTATKLIDGCRSMPDAKYLAQELCDHLLKVSVDFMEASQEAKDAKAELVRIQDNKETEKLYEMFDLEKIEKPQSILPDDPENNMDDASVKSLEKDKERRRTKCPQDLLFDNTSKSSAPKDGPTNEPLRELNGNAAASVDTDLPRIKSAEDVVRFSCVLAEHTAAIRSLDTNDVLLASGSRDRQAIVTDISTGSMLSNFGPHEKSVNFVKFIPKTELLATGAGFFVRLFDLRTQEMVIQFQGSGVEAQPTFATKKSHTDMYSKASDMITSADVDIYGNYLFAGIGHDSIRVFDLRKMQCCGPKIQLSASGSSLYETDPVLSNRSMMNSLKANCLEDGSGEIQIVATHNSWNKISTVRYAPLNTENVVREVSYTELGSPATSAIGVGNAIICSNNSGRLYRYHNGKAEFGIRFAHEKPITYLSLMNTAEGSLLVSSSTNGVMHFWRYEGLRTLLKRSTVVCDNPQLYCTASSNKHLFVGGDNKSVSVYDIVNPA